MIYLIMKIKESHVNTESYKEALKGVVSVNISSGDQATDGLVNKIMEAINEFMFIKIEKDIYSAFEDAQREVDYLSQRTKEGNVTLNLPLGEYELKEVETKYGYILSENPSWDLKFCRIIKK